MATNNKYVQQNTRSGASSTFYIRFFFFSRGKQAVPGGAPNEARVDISTVEGANLTFLVRFSDRMLLTLSVAFLASYEGMWAVWMFVGSSALPVVLRGGPALLDDGVREADGAARRPDDQADA